MRLIVCRHEGGAAFMAAADGRMRGGRAGVCVVSRGPGLSNAMIGLHTAYHDATPLVVLIGQVERFEAGRMALQEQNYSRLLSDVTKLVIEVNEPQQASEAIARAFHIAESGTPGPVAIIVPEDVFDAETDAPVAKPRPAAQAGPLPEDIDRLAEMLAQSERPLIWVGTAMRPAEIPDVTKLAEQWVLPVMPTHRRPHLFDAFHPNYGGYMASRVHADTLAEMKKSDLLVALGERITGSLSQGFTFPAAPDPQLPLVHVWPDANEVGRVWRPDLGMACEPAAVVRALLAKGAPKNAAKRQGWVSNLNDTHKRVTTPEWQPTSDGVNFSAVIAEINKHLTDDATVTSDAGNFATFVHRYLLMKPGQMFLASVGRRNGFRYADGRCGLPAAARHAGDRVRRRRRRIDDRQRTGHRAAIRRQPGVHRFGQQLLWHHHAASRHALSRPALSGRHATDQSGLRHLGYRLRCQRVDHPHRSRHRRRHHRSPVDQGPAGRRARPYLAGADQRLAAEKRLTVSLP